MEPEDVAKRLVPEGVDIDFNKIKNYFPFKYKKRLVERSDKKVNNREISIEGKKKVASRLKKKLIEREKTPNIDNNFFNFANI